MTSQQQRPIDFGVIHARLPAGALVSILHRITGIVLVLLLPLAFYALDRSLQAEAGFNAVRGWFAQPLVRLALPVLAGLFALHFFAGIRHLLLDIDIGITRGAGRASAMATIMAALLTALLVAGCLYG